MSSLITHPLFDYKVSYRRALELQARLLAESERLGQALLSSISHELRTPLTVITGSLRTAMSEGISPKETQELIQNATESAAGFQ
jgi:K+-sensing histidine kinase KdpD